MGRCADGALARRPVPGGYRAVPGRPGAPCGPRRRAARRTRRATRPAQAPPPLASPHRDHSVLAGTGGALALGGLFLVTPSVGDAQARAQQLDRRHHVAYPGPDVPARFAASLVSTEDHRFYSEPGIDPFAVGRLVVGRLSGRPDQGGATLYQQLAKMLYTPGRSGIAVEAEQVSLGVKLALAYSRPQILQMYADVAYFGNGYYGLGAASCGYFGVRAAGLSWPQAAMLAGLVQAPTADNPIAHLAAARAREAHVLGRLVATGRLSRAQAARAYRLPLRLVGGHPGACISPSAR